MYPQIKICGLTRVDEAIKCAELGADAIGLVFFPKSPRFVTDSKARKICEALPRSVQKVGVFVDEPFEVIMEKVNFCGLTAVQLHGKEPSSLNENLLKEGLLVIKSLFSSKKPCITEAANYPATAFLVECGKGKLPGGNAIAWNYAQVSEFGKSYPMILAGGLDTDNVGKAIDEGCPDAVDVSSGVEKSRGRKDIEKVKYFINAVNTSGSDPKIAGRQFRKIF
jgi:phosphoribosylanthranilate isomerase